MRGSYIPRWRFTDSCGRPDVPGALHLGCTRLGCEPTEREASLFGCSDQQRWGWNASQIIGPVVELECYGLIEEKHSISLRNSSDCLSRPTVCQFGG